MTHLPHIQNTKSGANRHDPMHQSIFEVYFTLPDAIQSEFKTDEETLTEQVVSVSGLDVLNKTVEAGSQKFFGVDVSFLNPTMDTTYAEVTIKFNLNIRDKSDAWLLKIFKAWGNLGYNMQDGTRTLMTDYVSESLRIAEGNRDGTIFRSFIFHKVMLTGITGLDALEYTNNEAVTLDVKFRADYWDEDLA
jgi:hypothetical protein